MRGLVASAVFLVILGVAHSALAATRVATDYKSGVEVSLDGHMLTATIRPQPNTEPPDARAELMGHRVTAACGTRLAEGRGESTHRTRRWPDGRLSLRYWLGRDLSARVRWCVLEEAGGDIAVVFFKRRK